MNIRFWALTLLLATSCGKKEDVYVACSEAADCEAPEDQDAACVQKDADSDGFCSWDCSQDSDCAEADDEDFHFVCSPFESTEGNYCFPSCEDEDVADPEVPCPEGLECRSTGGGNENRKVCFPA